MEWRTEGAQGAAGGESGEAAAPGGLGGRRVGAACPPISSAGFSAVASGFLGAVMDQDVFPAEPAAKNGGALQSPRAGRRHGAERSRPPVPRVPRPALVPCAIVPTPHPTGSGADTTLPLASLSPSSAPAEPPQPPLRPIAPNPGAPFPRVTSPGKWSSGESPLSRAGLGTKVGHVKPSPIFTASGGCGRDPPRHTGQEGRGATLVFPRAKETRPSPARRGKQQRSHTRTFGAGMR